MLVIADCGIGNFGSIRNMLGKLGCEPLVTDDPDAISKASKVILAGVGAFDHGMKTLLDRGLQQPLRNVAARGVPFLGICLGMQLMMDGSEEGQLAGLSFVPGEVKRFAAGSNLPRVPHMGWNRIMPQKPCALIDEAEDGRRYYFVHSYYASCKDTNDVAATTTYGIEFVSMFERGNLYGVQFHPEKSHRFGMALLERFIAI
jgi:glutamine amidotransferase